MILYFVCFFFKDGIYGFVCRAQTLFQLYFISLSACGNCIWPLNYHSVTYGQCCVAKWIERGIKNISILESLSRKEMQPVFVFFFFIYIVAFIFMFRMDDLSSRHSITWSPSILQNFSLCIRSMCRPMCIFCLALYTQNGHWNCGSLPHSHFWWLRNDDFSLYMRPQSGQGYTGWLSSGECFSGDVPSTTDAAPLFDSWLAVDVALSADVGAVSIGNNSGCAPSRSWVINGMANRAFHWSQVRPAMRVILRSSGAVRVHTHGKKNK